LHFSRQEVKNAEFGHLMALFSKLQLKLVFKKEKEKRTRSKVEKERQLSMCCTLNLPFSPDSRSRSVVIVVLFMVPSHVLPYAVSWQNHFMVFRSPQLFIYFS